MAIDNPGFARTYFLVFAAHLAVIVLILSKPIGCSGRSENGRTLVSSPPIHEKSIPHPLNLELSGTSREALSRSAAVESVDPPSRLVLPGSEPVLPLVAPEPAPEQASNRQTVKDDVALVTKPPSRPEIPKKETPEKKPAKAEVKSETAKSRKTPKPAQTVLEKAESGRAHNSSNPVLATKPTASKPDNEAKPGQATAKRPAKPRTIPVSTEKEANSDPPAVPAKVVDAPETVRARPVVSAVQQEKEILRAKPVLPATLAEGPVSRDTSVDGGQGETPASGANMGAYQNTVRQMIQSRWKAPKGQPEAQMPEVLITINRDGAIVYSRLQRSSGNDVLDRSAMEAVRLRSQLPPLPSEYPEERYDLVIKFQLD